MAGTRFEVVGCCAVGQVWIRGVRGLMVGDGGGKDEDDDEGGSAKGLLVEFDPDSDSESESESNPESSSDLSPPSSPSIKYL